MKWLSLNAISLIFFSSLLKCVSYSQDQWSCIWNIKKRINFGTKHTDSKRKIKLKKRIGKLKKLYYIYQNRLPLNISIALILLLPNLIVLRIPNKKSTKISTSQTEGEVNPSEAKKGKKKKEERRKSDWAYGDGVMRLGDDCMRQQQSAN